MNNRYAYTRGFTLIELMVSVAIFSIIMVISLGALLSISAADRKAENVSSVMSNLNFAVESMTRNIRTGYNYNCNGPTGGDCASTGGTSLYLTSQDGTSLIYAYSTSASDCGQLAAAVVKGCIVRSTDGGTTYLPITSPEVVISSMSFYLRGSVQGTDSMQPNVIISIVGYTQTGNTTVAPTASQKTPFAIQTSVTQRLYDF